MSVQIVHFSNVFPCLSSTRIPHFLLFIIPTDATESKDDGLKQQCNLKSPLLAENRTAFAGKSLKRLPTRFMKSTYITKLWSGVGRSSFPGGKDISAVLLDMALQVSSLLPQITGYAKLLLHSVTRWTPFPSRMYIPT